MNQAAPAGHQTSMSTTCPRNLPQHFNGCTCVAPMYTGASGAENTMTGAENLDMTYSEYRETLPPEDAALLDILIANADDEGPNDTFENFKTFGGYQGFDDAYEAETVARSLDSHFAETYNYGPGTFSFDMDDEGDAMVGVYVGDRMRLTEHIDRRDITTDREAVGAQAALGYARVQLETYERVSKRARDGGLIPARPDETTGDQ